jgi:tetratricopeptide (TPR) repeat protein
MASINSDELFDLALRASQGHDTQKSIGLIKSAIDQSPEDARMWYMLGTQYAKIGIYDKAVANMENALKRDENYGIARFHLGLLYLMSHHQEDAETVWQSLDKLGELHYLSLFKQGLLKIVDDHLQEGIELIRSGIAANRLNESLNQDMETVIEHASLSMHKEASQAR